MAVSVTTVSGLASREHVAAVPPHEIRGPEIVPTTGGVTVSDATRPCCRFIPLKRSRSTSVSIPATVPVDVHCQKVQPRPLQFPAGTAGCRDPQWAIHSG